METVIVDAGPLIAYLSKSEADHRWTTERFQELRGPLRTCDAALSEAFFLLRESRNGSRQLFALLERRLVIPSFDLAVEHAAVAELMQRYESVPMSLADACLVRMSELFSNSKILTLDSDFRLYRKNRKQPIPLLFPE